MTSIASLRNHIPQQFQQFGLGGKNKTQQAPPPQPPPPDQQQNSQQGAAAEYYAASQEAYSQYPSPDATKTLELVPKGHVMAVATAGGGETLLTITFASSSSDDRAPDLIVLRSGGLTGDEVASAQFHRWTTSKTDLHIHGQKVKINKDFESATGLGKARWERDGRKGMKLLLPADEGGGKKKDVAARFEAVGTGKRKKGEGQFAILRDGLSRPQLEEVVISCLAERERMRRDGELLQGGIEEGIWELFMAGLGF